MPGTRRRDLDHVAGAIGALARASADADPGRLLDGVVAALAPVIPVRAAALWLGAEGAAVAVAAHPPTATPPPPGGPGMATTPLRGADRALGHLVVDIGRPDDMDPATTALLEIAAAQVAGALERARLYDEVFELERLKSDFIARVSHELRTPITIISGFLDTLLAHDERLDPDLRQQMLDRSRTAAARLGRLIEELLVLSRMEAGVVTPTVAPVDPGELLAEVRAGAIDPDQVTVGPAPAGTLRTDGALLARALGLLVDNALKHGGGAQLTATGPRRGARGTPGWQVEVRDRGPGFDPTVRATAFEMFTRGPATSVPGLGVGLAIARTLVEVLDGTLEIVDPDDGPGAVLRVRLP